MAYERSPAAPASFEPAVRGVPELPGRGVHSTTCTGRAGAARPSRVRADRAHCVSRSRRTRRVGRAWRAGGARRTIGAPAASVVCGSRGVRPAARSTGNAAGRHPPPAVLGAGGGALRGRS